MELQKLSASLVRTIRDHAGWQTVLEQLCDYTKCDKALISLRDLKTAEIVIPTDVAEEFSSPLIYGFDEAAVEAFLSDFGDVDPWTDVERRNHPYYPYAMSRHLSHSQLRSTTFWQWLEPQGIDDCVACELGRTDQYWAALNLYFSGTEARKSELVVSRLNDVLALMQSVWSSGREVEVMRASAGSMDMVLAAVDTPVALIMRTGELVTLNQKMRDFLKDQSHMIVEGERLPLPVNLPLTSDIDVLRVGSTDFRGEAKVSAFQSTEMAGGEMRDIYLLSIEPLEAPQVMDGQSIWDLETLTDRERTLVRHVAMGMKFREAQVAMGLSYPRVMQLWKSSRDKMGINDVNDLRLSYRLNQT